MTEEITTPALPAIEGERPGERTAPVTKRVPSTRKPKFAVRGYTRCQR